MALVHLNAFYFLWLVITCWNINIIFKKLTDEYGSDTDFAINIFGIKKVYLLNSSPTIKKILSNNGSELTYIQKNLNTYLQHTSTFNCVDSSTELWKQLHLVFKTSLNDNGSRLAKLIKQNRRSLFQKHSTLKSGIDSFLLKSWAQYTYGDDVNMDLYMKTRKMILDEMDSFHESNLMKVPILGNYVAKCLSIMHGKNRSIINQNLLELLRTLTPSVMRSVTDSDLPTEILSQNSLLMFLVYDFIYGVVIDFILDDTNELNQSFSRGFLYPVRYRINTEQLEISDHTIPSNSLVIYHLVNSEMFFSYGARACIGQTLFKTHIMPSIREIKTWIRTDQHLEYLSDSTDNIPFVMPIDDFEVKLPQNYLETHISGSVNANGVKMYDLISMYENTELFDYIVNKFANDIFKRGSKGIVAPEARALSLAGAVAYKLNLPIYTIRKKGKIPERFIRLRIRRVIPMLLIHWKFLSMKW